MGNLVIKMVGEGGATHYREATRLPFYLKELSDKEGKELNVECFVRPTSLYWALWSRRRNG